VIRNKSVHIGTYQGNLKQRFLTQVTRKHTVAKNIKQEIAKYDALFNCPTTWKDILQQNDAFFKKIHRPSTLNS